METGEHGKHGLLVPSHAEVGDRHGQGNATVLRQTMVDHNAVFKPKAAQIHRIVIQIAVSLTFSYKYFVLL